MPTLDQLINVLLAINKAHNTYKSIIHTKEAKLNLSYIVFIATMALRLNSL